jgi:hypothetical protein
MSEVLTKPTHAIRNVRQRQPDGSWVSPFQKLKQEHPNLKFYRDWNSVPLHLVSGHRAINLKLPIGNQPMAYLFDGRWVYPLYEVLYFPVTG